MADTPIDLNVSDGWVAVPTGIDDVVKKVRDVLQQSGGSLTLEEFRRQVEDSSFGGFGFTPYDIYGKDDARVNKSRELGFKMYRIKDKVVYERYVKSA